MENTVLKSDWKKVMKTSSKSSFAVLLFCGLSYLLLELFQPFIVKFLSKNGYMLSADTQTFFQYILLYLVIFPIIIVAFQIISKKENRVSIKSGFCIPKKSFWWVTKWLLISFSVSMTVTAVGSYLLFVISAVTGVDISGTDMFFDSASLIAIPEIVLDTVPTLIFAPIMEEILFRGVIYKNDEKLGCVFASITSSVLFGFWHMTLSQIILASVLGFFSCYLYRKTKSIFPSMILHFLNNFKSVIGIIILKRMGVTNMTDYMTSAQDIVANHLTELMLLLVFLLVIGVMNLVGFSLLVITIVNKKMKIKPDESVAVPVMKNDMESFVVDTEINEPEINACDIIEEPEIIEEKMSGFKKALLYYCSPVTIVTYGVLIYGLVMRIL